MEDSSFSSTCFFDTQIAKTLLLVLVIDIMLLLNLLQTSATRPLLFLNDVIA